MASLTFPQSPLRDIRIKKNENGLKFYTQYFAFYGKIQGF